MIRRGEPPKRKTPLRRSEKPLKRSRLERVAWTPSARSRARTRAREEAWIEARDAHLVAVRYRCEVCPVLAAYRGGIGIGPWRRCTGRAVTCHHALARGMGGSNDHSRIIATCQTGHDWVEANPTKAEEMGLKVRHG